MPVSRSAQGHERKKRIYFFGAGASAAESPVAPTSTQLFELFRADLGRRADLYPTLRAFLAEWGFDRYDHLPTFEEFLSILDACLTKGEPLGQHWSVSELTKCREELVGAIFNFIGSTYAPPGTSALDNGVYSRLIEQIDEEGTSLISLNYDTLLDRALLRAGLVPDYGMDFREPSGALTDHEPRESGGRRMKLFKLHGSLNWSYCPACFSTVRMRRGVAAGSVCPFCSGRQSPLILPPTPIKVPPSPFLSALWKQAEWELAQAAEITFIGYSLGDADANIRYLLFRGFFGATPRVTVVLDRQDPTVTGRYNRLFPAGVEFFSGGFDAFVRARGERLETSSGGVA